MKRSLKKTVTFHATPLVVRRNGGRPIPVSTKLTRNRVGVFFAVMICWCYFMQAILISQLNHRTDKSDSSRFHFTPPYNSNQSIESPVSNMFAAPRYAPRTAANVKVDGDGRLPIYWINLDKSKERRSSMDKMFARMERVGKGISPIRVPAIDILQVKTLVEENRIFIDGTLVDQDDEPTNQKHERGEFLYHEAACLISHLTTILQAYNDGHELILVLEDDVVLDKEFLLNWESCAALAPSDWNVLQWSTNNQIIIKQGLALSDPWISWQPDHWSTRAYMLRRDAMRQIIERTSFVDTSGRKVWHVTEPGMVVADEVIYYMAKPSYTSTYSWIQDAGFNSTISDSGHAATATAPKDQQRLLPASTTGASKIISSREERILVLTNLRMKNEREITADIHRLRLDVEALSVWHPDSKWVVNTVLTNHTLKPYLDSLVVNVLPNHVDLRVQVSEKRFNKFRLVKSMLDELSKYDYVLLKDSDIRVTGFPWNSFMQKKGDAVVSGPLCESTEESLFRLRNKPKRQFYQFHNGHWWKNDKNFVPMYTKAAPMKVPFIEQFMVLLQADFAQWFFSRTLLPKFLDSETDFGPDLMWCGAANEFRPKQSSCHLVPVVTAHEDSRTMTAESATFNSSSMIDWFRDESPVFRKWMKRSDPWTRIIWDYNEPKLIMKECSQLIGEGDFTLQECAEYAWEGTYRRRKKKKDITKDCKLRWCMVQDA
jgi:GR25 family glycosyltransferase involved in LPS biosynthesis